MEDKVYVSIRMTEAITQHDSGFDQVRFTNAISRSSRRRQRFNLRALMVLPIIAIGFVLLSACQQDGY